MPSVKMKPLLVSLVSAVFLFASDVQAQYIEKNIIDITTGITIEGPDWWTPQIVLAVQRMKVSTPSDNLVEWMSSAHTTIHHWPQSLDAASAWSQSGENKIWLGYGVPADVSETAALISMAAVLDIDWWTLGSCSLLWEYSRAYSVGLLVATQLHAEPESTSAIKWNATHFDALFLANVPGFNEMTPAERLQRACPSYTGAAPV